MSENEVRALRMRIAELEQLRDEMYAQLGGGCDPRESPDHPGHILLQLGWAYCPEEDEPDYYGCFWRDPEAPRGKVEIMPLSMALDIALNRLYQSKKKT